MARVQPDRFVQVTLPRRRVQARFSSVAQVAELLAKWFSVLVHEQSESQQFLNITSTSKWICFSTRLFDFI